MSVDATADALAQEFAATAAEHDRTGSFPHRNIARLRETGLAALVAPRNFSGRGAGLAEANRVVNAIARGEASTGLILAQQYLFHAALARDAAFSPALREQIFTSAAREGAFVNALRVEPELGTPIRGGLPATTARRTTKGWRLNGRKIYSTGAPALGWFAIWARTDEPEPRVGAFLVPAGAAGLRIEETWSHLGMRASGSHDVVLEHVDIPFENAASPRRPEEIASPDAITTAWIAALFSTVYDGAARAGRDWLVKFLRERRPSNLGASLASLPRMQEAVGEIDSALYASRVLLVDLAARGDRDDVPSPQDSFYVKHNVTKNALFAVSKAMELTGNPGLAQANPLERHYRDVMCARVHSPQNDSIFLSGGRFALA